MENQDRENVGLKFSGLGLGVTGATGWTVINLFK